MLVTVTVDVCEKIVEHVKAIAFEMNGVEPTRQKLIEFFEQDIAGVYDNYAADDTIDDAAESFFYMEESGLKL